MKKIILLALFAIVGVLAASQLVYADTSTLSASPLTASKNVGKVFNVSVQLNPASNEVCVISGILNFSNLTCQSITVAGGVMAQSSPTCDNPSFTLGIPGCTTAVQNIFSVSVAGTKVGQASLSVAGVENLGPTGTDVPSGGQGGTYNITAVPAPKTALAPAPAPVPVTPISCTPNWQVGGWDACTDGQQTRTVTDLNNCGVTTDEPDTIQSCEQPPVVIVTKQNVGVAGFLSVAYAYRWLFLIALIFLCATYFIYWFIVAKRRKKKEENKK